MKIRGKVNLALGGAFVVGLLIAGGGAYKVLTDEAVDGSGRDARIIMEQASAIRAYTLAEIYPLLDAQLKEMVRAATEPARLGHARLQVMDLRRAPGWKITESEDLRQLLAAAGFTGVQVDADWFLREQRHEDQG